MSIKDNAEELQLVKELLDTALKNLFEAQKILNVLDGSVPRQRPLFYKGLDKYPKSWKPWEGNKTLDDFLGED